MSGAVGTSSASAPTKHMDIGFEIPRELETLLHERVLATARREQRVQFRPGVQRGQGGDAIDVIQLERTKKKLARAIVVLRDEYGVSDELVCEALAYTNSWEDALRFLALQHTSEELPTKLRAMPGTLQDAKTNGDDIEGALDVVPAPAQMETETVEEDKAQEASEHVECQPADSWEDAADETPPTATTDDLAPASAKEGGTKDAPAQKEEDVQEAMSWTQRYLLQLAQEEEREKELAKQEAATTPEERKLRDLEAQYTSMVYTMEQGKASGKLTKKKVKARSQEIQRVRFELVQLGWHEAEYHQKQKELRGESATDTKKSKKNKSGKTNSEANQGDDDASSGAQVDAVIDAKPSVTLGNDDDDENYGGGLFDEPTETPKKSVQPASESSAATTDNDHDQIHSVLASFSASAPASWTGKSPRDLLQDYCQKHKMHRPQYKKLSTSKVAHLYSVVLDRRGGPKKEYKAQPDLFPIAHGFRTIDEAKDTVATVTLYELTPDRPLYGLMPPAYRALWLEWQRVREAEAAASTNAVKQEFDSFVDEIYRMLPEEIVAKIPVVTDAPQVEKVMPAKPIDAVDEEEKFLAGNTAAPLDSWDLDDWDADISDDEVPVDGDKTGDGNAAEDGVQSMDKVEEVDDLATVETSRGLKHLFEKNTRSKRYQSLLKRRLDLPIAHFRTNILDALDAHNVILISGETGCGKSTQVPQYVIEDMLVGRGRGAHCQVVCTQPRRLAAISLAERVSQELGEPTVGKGDSLCGFQIRLENRMTKNTRLLFCTTGILLRKLQDPSTLAEELSHIIVDEVHERDVQNDVLLSMLRTFLETKNQLRRHPLKVILMSATLNALSFQRYFGGEAVCPMLEVPGRTFPVEECYLEDALEVTNFVVEEDSPCYRRMDTSSSSGQSTKITVSGRGGTSYTQSVSWSSGGSTLSGSGRQHALEREDGGREYSDRTWKTLDRLEESVINYELIEQLLEHLVTECAALQLDDSGTPSASVLIFLPGLQEISNMLDVLSANRVLRDHNKFELLPLHSSLSPDDQRRIFDMPRGVIRIIAATNIAETSLTIEDVKVVIDSGRAKEMRHNSTTKTNLLEEIWISRANAKQRLGRAGRTSGGLCYRMFSRSVYHHKMVAQPLPEIKRAPLTSLCLQIKTFGVEASCAEFLDGCLDPPEQSSVNDALRELFEIGAIEVTTDGAEQLTTLGGHLAKLPVDVKVGKLLLIGAICGEFDAVSTTAAIMETKSPFVAPYGFQKEMQTARQHFAVAHSDWLTDVNVFNSWRRQFFLPKGKNTSIPHGHQSEKAFCRQYFLSRRSLMEIVKLKQQFHGIIAQIGFLPTANHGGSSSEPSWVKPLTKQSCSFVAALLYAGMEPNVMYVDPGQSSKHRAALRDEDKTTAYVHPGSINTKMAVFPSPFLTYSVKLHTSQIYLPSSTVVMPAALCIFSFSMDIVFPHRNTDRGLIGVRLNEWIMLHCSLRSAVLLHELRTVVQRMITHNIENPPFTRNNNSNPSSSSTSPGSDEDPVILETLSTLFQNEYAERDPKETLTKQII